jgi:hypothetical protein
MRQSERGPDTDAVTANPSARYVLAAGDDAPRVLDECRDGLVDRVGGVVVVLTDPTTALRLVRSGGGHVHVYDREQDARAGLALFVRSPVLNRGPR